MLNTQAAYLADNFPHCGLLSEAKFFAADNEAREMDAAGSHSSATVHGRLHAVAGKKKTAEERSDMRCLPATCIACRVQ